MVVLMQVQLAERCFTSALILREQLAVHAKQRPTGGQGLDHTEVALDIGTSSSVTPLDQALRRVCV